MTDPNTQHPLAPQSTPGSPMVSEPVSPLAVRDQGHIRSKSGDRVSADFLAPNTPDGVSGIRSRSSPILSPSIIQQQPVAPASGVTNAPLGVSQGTMVQSNPVAASAEQNGQPVTPTAYVHDDIIVDIFKRFQDPDQSIVPVEDVPQDVSGLHQLIKRGAWKSVISLANKMIAQSKMPHMKLRYRLCRLLAMIKLRLYQAAYSEFVDIGRIDDPKNLHETYPELYPNKTGSMLPFTLRILYAEAIYSLGKDTDMNYLFSLRALCQRKMKETESAPKIVSPSTSQVDLGDQLALSSPSATSDPLSAVNVSNIHFEDYEEDNVDVWVERYNRIAFSIATKHIANHDFPSALRLLNTIAKDSEDIHLLSAIARVYYQMGFLAAGDALIGRVEQLISNQVNSIPFNMNRGISLFYKEKYTDAAGYFEKVLGLDCFNVVATNNLALCHLHLGSVTKAIEIIEDIMFSDPDKTLHEVVVYNLCTFYDLVTEKSLDKRKKILQLVRDHAPDNFNLGSLKLSS